MNATAYRRPYLTVSDAVAELHDRNRVLFFVALAHLALAVVFTGLMAVDGRTLLGRNVWTKPWKFATSIAIFTATMGWILPSLELPRRIERRATYVIAASMSIEIALISTQAARGVASHFNNSTALNSTVFTVMGATITVNTLVVGYVLWRTVRDPPDLSPAYLWALGIGMLVFVVASFEGWLMVAMDGHAVGAPEGGPGLPLVNWSVTGGDLRAAHFVGLHALQVVPLTGYLATRWDGLSGRGALATVGAVATLYGGLTGATFALAVLGTPLVPEGVVPSFPSSLLAGVLLVATVCGAAILAVVWQSVREP